MAKDKKPLAKIIVAGTQEIRHDLFKLDVANHKKNISYKKDTPKIEEVEHCHFFHSRNDKTGRDNTHCTFALGHTHAVEVEWDAAGEQVLSVHCGPALKERFVKLPDGNEIKELVPVQYKKHAGLGGGFIEDDHTHELSYIQTEFLSKKGMEAMRLAERQKAAHYITQGTSNQAQVAQNLENRANSAINLGMKVESSAS